MNSLYAGRWGYWIGRVLTAWSVFAAILILIGMIVLPIVASRLAERGESALSELGMRAGELVSVVENAEDALLKTARALDASATTLGQAQTNIEEVGPLLDSIQALLGEEAPGTIIAMQAGLESAQSGARAMDQMLRVLSSLRFLTGVSYNPEEPLDAALQGISDSLDPMPPALISVSEEVETFGVSLEDVGPELGQTAGAIGGMSVSMRTLARSLSGPAEGLESLSGSLDLQAQTFRRRVWIGVLVLEILLIQFVLMQLISGYVGGLLLEEQKGSADGN